MLVLAPEAINDGARGSILIGRFDGQLVGHRGVRLTLLVVASLPRPGLLARGIIRVPPVYPNCRSQGHGTREVAAAQRFHEEGQLIRNQ